MSEPRMNQQELTNWVQETMRILNEMGCNWSHTEHVNWIFPILHERGYVENRSQVFTIIDDIVERRTLRERELAKKQ